MLALPIHYVIAGGHHVVDLYMQYAKINEMHKNSDPYLYIISHSQIMELLSTHVVLIGVICGSYMQYCASYRLGEAPIGKIAPANNSNVGFRLADLGIYLTI